MCPLGLIKPLGHFGTRASVAQTFFARRAFKKWGLAQKEVKFGIYCFCGRGPSHPALAFLLDHPPPSEIGQWSGRLASSSLNSHYPLPWGALKYSTKLNGFETSVTEAQLKDAPAFSDDSWADDQDPHVLQRRPYW